MFNHFRHRRNRDTTILNMSENRQETAAQETEFNWDSLGKKQQFYSKEERSRLEEMYDTTLKQITEHDVIDGVVVGMTTKDVLVNIGYKI